MRLSQRRRVARVLGLAFAVLVAFVATLAIRRVFLFQDRTISGDGQIGIRYWEVARTSFLRGDGFPLWDRSVCAGHPFLGNPETGLLSSLIVGILGIRGDVMQRWYPALFTTIAILGVYAWGRRALRLTALGAMFAGVAWGASGFVSGHFSGHMSLLPFALIPWALYLARVGERSVPAAGALGLVLAIMAIEGGTYPVPYAILALFAVLIPRLIRRELSAVALVRLVGVAGLVFVLVAGIKLFPLAAQLARNPRPMHETDVLKWPEILGVLITRDRFGAMPDHPYVYDEYRAYMGPLICGMAIAGAGVSLILRPRRWELLALLVVSLLLMRGAYAEHAPYVLLSKVPVYGQLRVPSRFAVLLTLAIAAAAAVAFDKAREVVRKPALVAVLVLVAVFGVWDEAAAGSFVHKTYATGAWLPRPDPPPRAYALVASADSLAELPAKNQGVTTCQKSWSYPEGRNYRLGTEAPAIVVPSSAGRVTAYEVRQDSYDLRVSLSAPAVLDLNQNHDPDWRSDVGTVVRSADGHLAVQLPAGEHEVKLRYRPRGLVPGAVATGFGILLFAGLLAWEPVVRRLRRGT